MSIDTLRKQFLAKNIDAFFVNNIANVQYLSGFRGDNGFMLVCKNKAYFLSDSRFTVQAREEVKNCEVIIFQKEKGKNLIDTVKRLAARHGIRRCAVEADKMTVQLWKKIREAVSPAEVVETANILLNIRAIKSRDEVEAVEAAVAIAEEAFIKMLAVVKEGVRERDLAVELDYLMMKGGGDALAFPTIIAFGTNAAKPHAVPGTRQLKPGDLILVDFGVCKDGYNSDLTRTFFFGKISPVQKRAYNAVRGAADAVISRLRAGMTGREADMIARDYLAKQQLARYFTHSLGHGVGREVHENPVLSSANAQPLEPMSIVTIEPGVYNPRWGGIRIEDMALILPNKCRVLSSLTREPLVL